MDTNRSSSIILAVVLISAGVLLMFGGSVSSLHVSKMWPLFLMIPVAAMALGWLRHGKKAAGVAYPITLLTLFCVYFIWLNFAGWNHVRHSWPMFIMIPGVSFLVLYLATREKRILVPAGILCGLGILFLSGAGSFVLAAGLALTMTGVYIIIQSFKAAKAGEKPQE